MCENRKMTALVTGASSGIGKAIAKMLTEEGYIVYGIGRTFSENGLDTFFEENTMSEENIVSAGNTISAGIFRPVSLDLLDTEKLNEFLDEVKDEIDVLVNSAGVGYYGLHEELSETKIKEIIRTNLEAPILITNKVLREMKKKGGTIVNISSVTAEEVNPHGAAYGAAKAGLTSFTRSIFQEARKHNVRVFNIEPDMTDSKLYRNADFEADTSDEMAFLSPNDVARAVKYALNQRDGVVVTDIRLTPQIKRIRRKAK